MHSAIVWAWFGRSLHFTTKSLYQRKTSMDDRHGWVGEGGGGQWAGERYVTPEY